MLQQYDHHQQGADENVEGDNDVQHSEPVYRPPSPPAKVATLEATAKNQGKPEQALPKIVEGMLNGWYKERVLLEQPYAKDDKQTVKQVLGSAEIVRFAQVVIGG